MYFHGFCDALVDGRMDGYAQKGAVVCVGVLRSLCTCDCCHASVSPSVVHRQIYSPCESCLLRGADVTGAAAAGAGGPASASKLGVFGMSGRDRITSSPSWDPFAMQQIGFSR